jgi:hypothetical protein
LSVCFDYSAQESIYQVTNQTDVITTFGKQTPTVAEFHSCVPLLIHFVINQVVRPADETWHALQLSTS